MKSKSKELTTVSGAASGLLEKLKESRELDKQRLLFKIRQAGGPDSFLAARCPNLSRLAPDGVSLDALAGYTEAELADAEKRAQACSRCRSGAAECASDRSGHKRGHEPDWQTGQLVFSSCENWPEYQIQQRIIAAGVPRRHASCAVKDYEDLLDTEARASVARFVRESVQGEAPSLIVGGARSTEIAVGLLRAVARKRSDVTFRFARGPALVSPLKSYFSDARSNEDPLDGFGHVKMLVIAALSPMQDAEWLTRVLRETVSNRYNDEKTTIVATDHEGAVQAGAIYFGEDVPICLVADG